MSQFHIPQNEKTKKNLTYLCGHSLGLQPQKTKEAVEKELGVWQDFAVEGHFKEGSHWYSYHEKVSESLARLVGAQKTDVVAMNSLTTNLHLMLVSFFRPTKERFKILAEAPFFPSDKYALDSALRFHGLDPQEALVRIETLKGDSLISTDELIAAIEKHQNQLALVYLNPLNYLSGQALDMEQISKTCQKYGILLGLDLAHSIGNIELHLNQWGVDFAIWCSYKYLNAGPGAIGGCYVNSKHHRENLPRFEGWWGTNAKTRFQMGDVFESAFTAEAWQLSNPPILMLASLRASLDIFDQTSMKDLTVQGAALTGGFVERVKNSSLKDQLHIINEHVKRGNMLCMRVKNPDKFGSLKENLVKADIIVDYRKPDVLRFSFCPLYNTKEDVEAFAQALGKSL